MNTIITMKPVEKSGAIAATGYDAATKTLAVQFKGGKPPYYYAAVPPEVYANFMAAESMGTHFAHNIRGNFEAPPLTHIITAEADGEGA